MEDVKNKISAFYFTDSDESKESIQGLRILKNNDVATANIYLFASFFNLDFDDALYIHVNVYTPMKEYISDAGSIHLRSILEDSVDKTLHIAINSAEFKTDGYMKAELVLSSKTDNGFETIAEQVTYCKLLVEDNSNE